MSIQSSITCPQCGMTSYNHYDIEQRYCGNCRMFHDQMELSEILKSEVSNTEALRNLANLTLRYTETVSSHGAWRPGKVKYAEDVDTIVSVARQLAEAVIASLINAEESHAKK